MLAVTDACCGLFRQYNLHTLILAVFCDTLYVVLVAQELPLSLSCDVPFVTWPEFD